MWNSAFVGQSSKYIFHDIAAKLTLRSSEFKSIQNFIDKETIVIGISQSEHDTIEALEIAKSKGATQLIVNNENSTMFRICDFSIQKSRPKSQPRPKVQLQKWQF